VIVPQFRHTDLLIASARLNCGGGIRTPRLASIEIEVENNGRCGE
jgi:hypothetical protein